MSGHDPNSVRSYLQRGKDTLLGIFMVLVVINLAGYYLGKYMLYIIGGLVIVALAVIFTRAINYRRRW